MGPGVTRPLTELPDGYVVGHVFDLRNGIWFLVLNVLAVPLALLAGAFYVFLAAFLRSESVDRLFLGVGGRASWLWVLLSSLLSIIARSISAPWAPSE